MFIDLFLIGKAIDQNGIGRGCRRCCFFIEKIKVNCGATEKLPTTESEKPQWEDNE
jgi:hypothetical protein